MDDPAASQEQKAEDFEAIEKTPERSLDDDTKLSTLLTTPGSESSSKRKGKRAVRKKKKTSTEEEAVVDPAVPLSPSVPARSQRLQKLIIRPGKSSKGGEKK